MHTYIHVAYARACARTHIHTYHTHTYIYTHIQQHLLQHYGFVPEKNSYDTIPIRESELFSEANAMFGQTDEDLNDKKRILK